ncbi:MAG: Phosphate transport system permease protein PstC [Myxococcaceae bacterium]|nr:Phosphate transport system permease protein PstC [Myxococcaceae bacterium]
MTAVELAPEPLASASTSTRREASPRRRLDAVVRLLLVSCAAFVLVTTAAMLLFLGNAGLKGVRSVGLAPLLSGALWKPEADVYGGLPLIFGTFVSAGGAVVIGAIPAVLAAVWATEFAPRPARPTYRRIMEVAAAVPSVVYGWLALVYLIPQMEKLAHLLLGDRATGGEGLATAAVLLGVMIAPTVLLLSLDALARVPSALRDASAALGASPWQTAMRVVVPHGWRGIIIAVFFGFARAAGETMAVQMVIGGARQLPANAFSPTTTISTQIVMDMQNAQPGSTGSNVLFAMSLVLLVVAVTVVLCTRWLSRGTRTA